MAESNPRVVDCNNYITCASKGMTLEEILAAIVVKINATGCYAINTVAITGTCDDITQAIQCGTNESWEELVMKTAVFDDCGNPAIAIFAQTRQ